MKFSLTAGFGLLLALLATNCALTYRAISMLQQDQRRIAAFQDVRVELGAILNDYVNAETGQRGYVLTGNEDYLTPYYSALAELSKSNTRLNSVLAPMPQLNEARARMEAAGNKKLAELAETIQLRKEKGFDAAQQLVLTGAGKNTMDEIRALAAQIDDGQKNEMNLLLKDAEGRKTRAEEMSVAASAILALALCLLFNITRRNINERARLFEQEQQARAALQRALAAERAAHSEAAHANKLKDEFLSIVSHELRTPLNAIVGWTNLLREGAGQGELEEGLASIEKNAHAQARLVDDLLDVSRIVSGKLRINVTEVDLHGVARSVIESLRPAANARGVEVSLNATDESTLVAGDADRLRQIVWNLLSNAIKFTPRGGSVKISLFHVESDVALEISDTGQGIKPEFLPRIFERFSQQDASTTRDHSGLGLGLSITRQLAELHGGKITASSEGENKGSTFRLQIPIRAVHDDNAPADGKNAGETAANAVKMVRNLRVLAVDDQSDALAVVSRVLTRAGAEVRTAESVKEARAILSAWRPDLIISDIGMPGEDGYAFIHELRNSKDSALRTVPAIALTAFAREGDRFKAIGAGFNDHLSKPVLARALIEKAAEIAGRV